MRVRCRKPLFVLAAAVLVAMPILPTAASAEQAPARLDDDVAQRVRTSPASALIPVIVEGAPSAADTDLATGGAQRAQRAEDRIRGGGGHFVGTSPLLGATVAELTPAQIRTLASDPSIGRIHVDSTVNASAGADSDEPTGGATPIVFQQTVGARQAWRAGDFGQGVTVAVLDTGIDAHNAAFGGRVKASVDMVDPAHPVLGDPAGHGTHVAGIIAASRTAPSPGIAPDASLVSVRVLDAGGGSRLSTVIHGLEWVIAHKQALGIRVVVMALGAPAVGSYRTDPLSAMAELAWHSGLVVVTAAGNAGPGAGTIQTPGIDPLVLTVGADDENGTALAADDSIPSWSSAGPTADGVAKPELVAPGRKIVSVRVPGSTTDRQSPTHIESPTTIRFSGTSESTGVVAGAVAVLLEQRPRLSPDQVKALLVGTARSLAGGNSAAKGAGLLNVPRALAAASPVVRPSPYAPSEGLLRLVWPQVRDQLDPGHVGADGVRWDGVRWDGVRWDGVRWDGVRWDGVRWDGVRWDGVRWDGVRWDGVRWDQTTWD